MPATVIIPARLGSTRFPEKMLADRTGKPLVQHVVDRVMQCKRVDRVIVATDHARIAEALRPFGTTVAMTDPNHPSGTDRIAEVARRLGDDVSAQMLINVQGDEPEIDPTLIDRLVERLEADPNQNMVTAAVKFPRKLDVNNPNHVKVVISQVEQEGVTENAGRAIYFSRWPVPYVREMTEVPVGHLLHLGIYGYRRSFLLRYASWRPTPLEQAEKLEQLRAIEHGVSIGVVVVGQASNGIDTPEQYEEFVQRYAQNEAQTKAQNEAPLERGATGTLSQVTG